MLHNNVFPHNSLFFRVLITRLIGKTLTVPMGYAVFLFLQNKRKKNNKKRLLKKFIKTSLIYFYCFQKVFFFFTTACCIFRFCLLSPIMLAYRFKGMPHSANPSIPLSACFSAPSLSLFFFTQDATYK